VRWIDALAGLMEAAGMVTTASLDADVPGVPHSDYTIAVADDTREPRIEETTSARMLRFEECPMPSVVGDWTWERIAATA
jgi:hypothetical protein